MSRLGLRLTPHGRLSVEDQDDRPEIDAAASIRLIDAFSRGTGYGLVWLGAAEVGQALPPLFVWWRDFAALYVGSLCLHASRLEAGERVKLPSLPAPTAAELSSLVLTAPIMPGAEYLTEDVLLALWDEMERAFAASLAAAHRREVPGGVSFLTPFGEPLFERLAAGKHHGKRFRVFSTGDSCEMTEKEREIYLLAVE
jgi:hypothetical protein